MNPTGLSHAESAKLLVCGDRNAAYGNPEADFRRISAVWTGIIGEKLLVALTPADVALMMTGLKLVRHAHKPKDDNLIDAHGYLDCLEWIERGQPPHNAEAVSLRQKLADANATVEAVCTGGRLICPNCTKAMPCMCEHAPNS